MATLPVIGTAVAPAAPEPAPREGFIQKIEGDFKHAETVMERIGKDAGKALHVVGAYLPAAATLAEAIFPTETASIAGVVNVVSLIQNTVASVEQKWVASGASTGNGAEKLSDVMTIVEPAVVGALDQAGVKADSAYVTNLVNVVVGILNVRSTPAS